MSEQENAEGQLWQQGINPWDAPWRDGDGTEYITASYANALEERLATLRTLAEELATALVEAALPLEALLAVGGTGIQAEIQTAVMRVRAVIAHWHAFTEAK